MGLFTARITGKELALLSRRMGISLAAGVDLRKVLQREADGAGRQVLLNRIREISEQVNEGVSFARAVQETGEFFPLLFRELVAVGEQTGHLPGVFHQMADHYDFSMKQRKTFLSAVAGSMIQLTIAVCIVGFLIGFASVVQNDILGLGLTGMSGLIIWFGLVGIAGAGVALVWRAFLLDLPWVRPVKRFLVKVPAVGHAVTLVSMARLTWVLSLTFNSGMDVKRAIRLALRSSMHPKHREQEREVNRLIDEGNSVFDTFVLMGCFDALFLDSIRTGEEAGMIAEMMGRLAKDYQERALLAISALSIVASWTVWLLVAGFIIFFIFRIFGTYLGAIQGV